MEGSATGVRDKEVIIVTGERSGLSLFETDTSVTVIGHDQIEDMPAPDRIEDLLAQVPNVTFGSGGDGPTVRGMDATGALRDLSAFLGGNRPRLTVQIDGRAISYNELAFGLTSIWDVHQVEVFRSPQTTTQGRNAIGGAIFVETRDPAFAWDGRARFILGDAHTRQLSGSLSVPVVDDALSVRFSGDMRRSRTSSQIENRVPQIDYNDDRSDLARIKLIARPGGAAGPELRLSFQHVRSQMPQIVAVSTPFRDRQDKVGNYGYFDVRVDALTARISTEAGSNFSIDASASIGDAHIVRHARKGWGEADTNATDRSGEIVVRWRPARGLRVLAGISGVMTDTHQSIDVSSAGAGLGRFDDRQRSLGLFAEVTQTLANGLELGAGLRWQEDRQDRAGTLASGLITLDYDRTFSAFLPKVSVAWDVHDGVRLGALAQKAYNPGGTTIALPSGTPDAFAAETLWDYEVFARAQLADGGVKISANVFRYDIRNAQRRLLRDFVGPDGTTAVIAETDNAPRAWSRGAEVSIAWSMTARLALDAALGLLDTRITRTLSPSDPILGKQFQRSPHLTSSFSARWNPSESLLLNLQMRGHSPYFSDDAETAAMRVPGALTVDANVAFDIGPARLTAYARNMFNAFNLTHRYSEFSRLATAEDPRELGIGIEGRF
ncbi:TonB-dependent receptor [Croceicoccus ponticola]|nr:TonB-dependent receptor [Croceicoccus ponticola]